jgi:phosphoglycolate phosphatase-like HAD superfamily hydrolase
MIKGILFDMDGVLLDSEHLKVLFQQPQLAEADWIIQNLSEYPDAIFNS